MLFFSLAALLFGAIMLMWSADKFVVSSAVIADHYKVPALLIGIVIVGFGTSAPELIVSAMAALQNNSAIALGNAFGSNIINIGLVLGVTALIRPISVHSKIIRKELPVLIVVTALAIAFVLDYQITRLESVTLLACFFGLLGWNIRQGFRYRSDALIPQISQELRQQQLSHKRALWGLLIGLVLLLVSSRILLWGALNIAQYFGMSDLIVGLTVIAIGTSLPELAASSVAAMRGEFDIAIGNIIGANLFNTLCVVSIAGLIAPIKTEPSILYRDSIVMSGLTLALFLFSFGLRGRGKINRLEGGILLCIYLGYMVFLVVSS